MSIIEPLYLSISSVEIIHSRTEHLKRISRGKRVLHVGASDWPITREKLMEGKLLHSELAQAASECYGIDLSEDGIKLLRKHGHENLVLGDAQELGRYFDDNYFDMIIAGEVVEHMPNPGLFLDSCKQVLKENGTLVITVPNTFYVIRNVLIFAGWENCHKDHVSYYSPKTLTKLLSICGFDIVYMGMLFPKANSVKGKLFYMPFKLLFRYNPILGRTLLIHAEKQGSQLKRKPVTKVVA